MESICILQNERATNGSNNSGGQLTKVVLSVVHDNKALAYETSLPLLLPFKYVISKRHIVIWATDKTEADILLDEFLADCKFVV